MEKGTWSYKAGLVAGCTCSEHEGQCAGCERAEYAEAEREDAKNAALWEQYRYGNLIERGEG